jgi:hypothetical protein
MLGNYWFGQLPIERSINAVLLDVVFLVDTKIAVQSSCLSICLLYKQATYSDSVLSPILPYDPSIDSALNLYIRSAMHFECSLHLI